MHDVIKFLKDAVSRGVAAGLEDSYVIDGKMIRAYSDFMHAGIPWPSKKAFAVPAKPVEDFLARVDAVQKIKVEDSTVTLSTGKLRSTIDRRFEDPQPIPDLPEDWTRSPPGLGDALKKAQPFTGEGSGPRVWVTTVRLFEDRVSAGNGQVMIDIKVPGLGMPRAKLLSQRVVDFVATQGDPDKFGDDDHTVTFAWDDGRWVRCRLVDATMDENLIQRIFNEIVRKEAPVRFDDDWRKGLEHAVALADSSSVIEITEAGFIIQNKSITSRVDFDTGVPAGHRSWWNAKHLSSIASVAESWDPGAYPSPALFLGKDVRGAISGHSKR